jgi:hypothetical protein
MSKNTVEIIFKKYFLLKNILKKYFLINIIFNINTIKKQSKTKINFESFQLRGYTAVAGRDISSTHKNMLLVPIRRLSFVFW